MGTLSATRNPLAKFTACAANYLNAFVTQNVQTGIQSYNAIGKPVAKKNKFSKAAQLSVFFKRQRFWRLFSRRSVNNFREMLKDFCTLDAFPVMFLHPINTARALKG